MHACPLASDLKATHVAVFTNPCTRAHVHMTRAMQVKHLCTAKINANHSLVQPGSFFFASVSTCTFYYATSKSRTVASVIAIREYTAYA